MMGANKITVAVALASIVPLLAGAQKTATETASLGWSATGLEEVRLFSESIGTAAMIIISEDQTVAAWGDTTHRYRAHSMRKSFLSALIGIAAERGEIDLTATLAELDINDRQPLSPSERGATVLQLLEARSGVYHPAASETDSMKASRPERGAHEPGSLWHYNNWDFNTLGTIYSARTGRSVGEAFAAQIAGPIGMEDFRIDDVRYQLEPEFSEHAAYKFRISARDLARFGTLFLNEGAWQDKQVVPADWVGNSTAVHSLTGEAGTKSGYGLMWWITAEGAHGLPPGSYTASGSGGQRLTVLPHIQTVVVHLMDTDERGGPRIGTSTYNRLLSLVLAARTQ